MSRPAMVSVIPAGELREGDLFAVSKSHGGPAWRLEEVTGNPGGWEWWTFVGPFSRGGFPCLTPSGRPGGLGLNGPTVVVKR